MPRTYLSGNRLAGPNRKILRVISTPTLSDTTHPCELSISFRCRFLNDCFPTEERAAGRAHQREVWCLAILFGKGSRVDLNITVDGRGGTQKKSKFIVSNFLPECKSSRSELSHRTLQK